MGDGTRAAVSVEHRDPEGLAKTIRLVLDGADLAAATARPTMWFCRLSSPRLAMMWASSSCSPIIANLRSEAMFSGAT